MSRQRIRHRPITGQERGGIKRLVHGAARRVAQRTAGFTERVLGVHVIPVRYDDPIPRTRGIDDAWWDEPRPLLGIDLRINQQLATLARWREQFRSEWNFPVEGPAGQPSAYFRHNPSYGTGDAEILWGMIRERRPRRVLEIGSGMTSRLVGAALETNRVGGTAAEFVAVDPFPGDVTRRGLPGLSRLVVEPAQEFPLDEFRRLGAGDVLLIDSSHMFKMRSDVAFLLEEVLPRLDAGILVHFHDVYLPRPYPPVVLREHRWFWNEQDALRLYLAENPTWEVVWAVNALYRDHYEAFSAAVPGLPPGHPGPCSFWIERRDA